MEIFSLPAATRVSKVIPKNAFDSYTTPRQRRKFAEVVARITWANKLAEATTNLSGGSIKEIQVFHIELKEQKNIDNLLETVERAIPYNVIYIISYQGLVYLYTTYKHKHPVYEDKAVVNWIFKTAWQKDKEIGYILHLKENLDVVFLDFCKQLCDPIPAPVATLPELVEYQRKKQKFERDISLMESAIAKEVQFNKKVELNIKLQKCLADYQNFTTFN